MAVPRDWRLRRVWSIVRPWPSVRTVVQVPKAKLEESLSRGSQTSVERA